MHAQLRRSRRQPAHSRLARVLDEGRPVTRVLLSAPWTWAFGEPPGRSLGEADRTETLARCSLDRFREDLAA